MFRKFLWSVSVVAVVGGMFWQKDGSAHPQTQAIRTHNVTYERTVRTATGAPDKVTVLREVGADGSFKLNKAGSSKVISASPEGTTLSYDGGVTSMKLNDSGSPRDCVSFVENIRRSANYVGTDSILGMVVYISRQEFADGPFISSEYAFAFETQCTPLRTIYRYRDGGSMTEEAMAISFK